MARKPRLKAVAQAVPQTREEADRLLGEIGALTREVERIEADLTDTVALAKESAKEKAAPLADALKSKFAALTAWAEANKSELLQGKRRSLTLTQGMIGWRWGNPAVKVGRGQDEAVVSTFTRLGLSDLLRVETSLDREAILKRPEAIEGIAGISIEQVESFFAKPLDVKVEQTATVVKLTGREAARGQADAA